MHVGEEEKEERGTKLEKRRGHIKEKSKGKVGKVYKIRIKYEQW